jgi:hypothetical protein
LAVYFINRLAGSGIGLGAGQATGATTEEKRDSEKRGDEGGRGCTGEAHDLADLVFVAEKR